MRDPINIGRTRGAVVGRVVVTIGTTPTSESRQSMSSERY